MAWIKGALLGMVLLLLAVGWVIWRGTIAVAADQPHHPLVYKLLEFAREQSIARSVAAADLRVPDLDDPDLLLAGGPDYNDMCATCHLQPGVKETDFSLGLSPAPPDLTRSTVEGDGEARARRQFWIIKHGIMASGMPAWGPTHDEQRIWAMVAFLQHLPQLSAQQYQVLTARGDGGGGRY